MDDVGIDALANAIGIDDTGNKKDDGDVSGGKKKSDDNGIPGVDDTTLQDLIDNKDLTSHNDVLDQQVGGVKKDQNNSAGRGFSGEAQVEISRLKGLLDAAGDDIAIARVVRDNPSIHQAISASVVQGDVDRQVLQHQQNTKPQSVNQLAGLPDDFLPIAEDFNDPSTESFRWLQARIDSAVSASQVTIERDREITGQINEQKRNFLSKEGRTQKDLDELIAFTNDTRNFDVETFWLLMQIKKRQNAGNRDQKRKASNLTGSIAAVPGGEGVNVMNDDAKRDEAAFTGDLLEMAKKRRGFLF